MARKKLKPFVYTAPATTISLGYAVTLKAIEDKLFGTGGVSTVWPQRKTSSMEKNEIDRWHEIVNEISDICNTSYVTDKMDINEVIDYYQDKLQKIYALICYPEDAGK